MSETEAIPELYEHRNILFINLVYAYRDKAFKTPIDDGWFVLGLNTKHGQITYCLHEMYWEYVSGISKTKDNYQCDEEFLPDMLERLLLMIRDD